MKIGFLGIGNMGAAIAPNLINAGHDVSVWNRSPDKAAALVAKGASHALTPADAAKAEVVFTMLADDAAVEGVADDIIANLDEGGIHISLSTISVALAEKLTVAHASKGQSFVAAPVFGRPAAAADAKLFITAAGAPEAMARVMPLLQAIGQKVEVFGETPSTANLVKLAGNFLIISVTETLGEAMALMAKGGANNTQFLDFLTSTLFGSLIYKNYGALIASQTFEPAGFAAALGAKDVRLVGEAADGLAVPMPLADLLSDRLARLVSEGNGHLDLTALSALAFKDAGLK
jgi:3-hydroxyisobutyrate dehydrogenase-like beta-hydroxyacid dehydrogenase